MGKIFLIKLNTANTEGGEQYRYELSNFTSLSYDLQTPVSPMPLPEENAKENILIKIEGNSGAVNLRWKLVDNNGVNLAIPRVTSPAQDPIPSSTIREQINFFKDLFAPESIDLMIQQIFGIIKILELMEHLSISVLQCNLLNYLRLMLV